MSTSSHGPTIGSVQPFRKRKERPNGLDGPHPAAARADPSADAKTWETPKPAHNRLLAGYLAHEFFTRGTLFGQPWDPVRAAEPDEPMTAYSDVASLLKGENGTHIAGVVNPSQLARWLGTGRTRGELPFADSEGTPEVEAELEGM